MADEARCFFCDRQGEPFSFVLLYNEETGAWRGAKVCRRCASGAVNPCHVCGESSKLWLVRLYDEVKRRLESVRVCYRCAEAAGQGPELESDEAQLERDGPARC